MQTKNIIISAIIGIIIIAGSFFAVFGSSLKNLTPQTPVDTSVKATTTVPVTNGAGTVNSSNQDEDDDRYDEDDRPTTSSTTQTKPVPATPATPTTPQSTGFTMAKVATHNSATSCWSAINGQVYDLTSWVNAHPGGKASILMICGKDGSPLFNAQHGGARKPATILAKYLIGSLN